MGVEQLRLDQELPFYPNGVYSNLICFYQYQVSAARVNQLCAPYQGGFTSWIVSKVVS